MTDPVPRLPPLLEAVLSVGTDLELRVTLQHIVDGAAELTGARYAALGVADPGLDGLVEICTAGPSDGGTAAEDDSADDSLGVPILVDDQEFGTLHLSDKEGGPFTDEDEQLLKLLATQAGIAIGNARLYEAARQRERWIEGAAAVTTALLTGEAAADALMTVAERARVLADAAAGVILQATPEGGMEIVTASTLDDPGDIVGTTIEPGSPVLEQLLGGEPVFIEDSATDPRMTTPVRSRFGPSMMLPSRRTAASSARSPCPAGAATGRTPRWSGCSPRSSPRRPRWRWSSPTPSTAGSGSRSTRTATASPATSTTWSSNACSPPE